MESYYVRLCREDLSFSGSHFITFDEDKCEELHGHTYRVSAEVCAAVDENHYVIDFLVLEELLRQIIRPLDQQVLLPAAHPRIRITVGAQEVEATFADRRWVFPRRGCSILPVPSTTTEMLARYIADRLREELANRLAARPRTICVELDEGAGRVAGCRLADEH